jgi:hypothetical protein
MRRHLTYANVAATLALVFSMSGGALAAKHYLIDSTKQINPKVLKSLSAADAKQFKKLSATATVAHSGSASSATSAATAGLATNATNATNAANATHAASATSATSAASATTAANALSLGGIPSSGYTRSDCISTTGQVKGFALVAASAIFPATFTKIPLSYNCSGESVEAERVSDGTYIVRFLGNPALIAIATSNAGASEPEEDVVAVKSLGLGEWRVIVEHVGMNERKDDGFELLVP